MLTENNSQELPSGSQTIDFDKIVEQSKENLAEVTAPKRGRGRPPGTFKKKPAEDAQKAPSEENAPHRDVDAVILKENEIEPLSCEIIKAPFDFVGFKSGIDITPNDDEAKAPTKYLSKLIECYLPDLNAKDPKSFNLIALVISFALLALKKFRLFSVIKRTKIEQDTTKKAENKNNGEITIEKAPRELPKESIDAQNLFSNRII